MSAANSGDALNAISKLREAIQTLPFFGSGKAASGCATAIFWATNAPRPPRPLRRPWETLPVN